MLVLMKTRNSEKILKNFLKLTFGLVITFYFLGLANAQQPTPTKTPADRERIAVPQESPKPKEQSTGEDEVIKVNSKLVVVPVSVINADNQPVLNLTAKDFQLQEEGKLQEITEVSNAEQVPLEIALLIDVSSSINLLFDYEKDAAARFLQNVMRPGDHASVFLIGEKPILAQPRDTAEKTAATIRAINPTKSQTTFFDTILAAINYLKKNSPEHTRRVILTLTDGEDTYSKNTLTAYEGAYREMDKKINRLTQAERVEIMNRYRLLAQEKNYSRILRDLQNADTVFYSINPAGASLKINKISFRGQDGLQKFANETGGTAFLPQVSSPIAGNPLRNSEYVKQNAENLEKIFQQIAAELRAQYLLQFYSESNFPTGKYVTLKAEVPSGTNLRVKARKGYFAVTQ
jgi:Ca-activated chloride channel family protein